MKMFTSGLFTAATILLVLMYQSTAYAIAASGASSLTYNTSSRAEAMGGAGAGLAWDANTNHWANPALLAFRPGIQYLDFHWALPEEQFGEIYLTSEELTVGAYGVTLLFGTGPVDGVYYAMGEWWGTDENGDPTGVIRPYMRSEHWGIGVDFFQLAEIIMGREPGTWTSNVTLSGGYVWKDFEDDLGFDPIQPSPGGDFGTGQASDWGLLLKWTAIKTGLEKGLNDGGTVGIEAGIALGYSKLNSTDQFIHHSSVDQPDPFPTMHVFGTSLRFALPVTDTKREQWNANGLGILGDVINPLFSFTAAFQLIQPGFVWDAAQQDYHYQWDTSGSLDEIGYGFEVGLANIFYYRYGHKKIDYSDVDGATQGFGVNLQAGRLGGARYDWASVPLSAGWEEDATSRTWSFWVDPVAIVELW